MMRVFNALTAGGAVILGAFLTPALIGIHVYLAALAVALITIAGNLINDYFDVKSDEINRPDRLIPSGKLKKKNALLISIFLFISGNIILSFIDWLLLEIGLAATFLLVIYTPFLKNRPLIGNIAISLLLSTTLIVGAIASAAFLTIENSVLPASLIFLISLPREILKDGEDLIGDREAGLHTFPVVFGIRRTRQLVVFILWSLIIWILLTSFLFGKLFALCAIPGIVFPLIIIIRKSNSSPTWFGNAQRILKLLIFPGFISLIMSNIQ
jgi:geranylgeranylglycerol-phosphate geranylgeranyltransferase